MYRPTTKIGFPALAALAVLLAASSAHSAIQVDASILLSDSIQSAANSSDYVAVPGSSDTAPPSRPATEGIYSVDLNSRTLPDDMSSQSSNSGSSGSGSAIVSSFAKLARPQASTPAWERFSPLITTWRGDPPLDPPKSC